MFCPFEKTDRGVKCPRCGGEVITDFPPHQVHAVCGSGPRPQCRYLGSEVRRQECPSCSGKVLLKLFACEKHGEATPDTQLAGVACCRGCRDYQPPAMDS